MRLILLPLVLAFVVGLFVTGASAQSSQSTPQSQISVMPLPAKIQLGSGRLMIDHSFSVSNEGANDPRIGRAVQRFLANLSHQTGIPIGFPPNANSSASRKAVLTIRAGHVGKPFPEFGEDESYTLDVTSSGASLTAPDTLGILQGLETFLQLVEPAPEGFSAPAVHIEDKPRFAWRGLMFDV